jgi:hypothetical protein
VSQPANDPTSVGAAAPAGSGQALLSLAEMEALAVKAARGAGLSWGMAEEAGAAVRWLASHGLPGPELLLRHLDAFDGREWGAIAPVVTGRVWRIAGNGALSPLAAGVALADRAGLEDGPEGDPLTLERLADPGLLLPFAAMAAGAMGRPLRIVWDGLAVVVTGDGVAFETAEDGVADPLATSVVVTSDEAVPAIRRATAAPRLVPLSVWQGLDRLAFRTYVPASTASRAGAGAGTTDND